MKEFLSQLQSWGATTLGKIVYAVLLVVLAFIVSAIVRKLVVKLVSKIKLPKVGNKNAAPAADGTAAPAQGAAPVKDQRTEIAEYVGKFAYLLTFILFTPGIFSVLGVESIATPLSSLMTSILQYIPNIIAATLVFIVGSLIAKTAKELLVPVFRKIRLDKLQEKAGIKAPDESKFSETLAYIVYVLIMIPVVIITFQALNISAISGPAVSMLEKIMTYLPLIVTALVVIWVGSVIAKFTGEIVKKLIGSSGADEKVKGLVGDKAPSFVLSKTIGMIVQVVLNILFIVEGMNILGLAILSNIGNNIIGYLPNVLASVLIAIAASLLGIAAEKGLKKGGLGSSIIVVRSAIWAVAAFMILNQLGIATKIVTAAFIIILAAIAVAFAVSFGIGGREFAKKQLEKLDKKIDNKE